MSSMPLQQTCHTQSKAFAQRRHSLPFRARRPSRVIASAQEGVPGLVSRRGALLASTILLAGACIPSAAHAEPKQFEVLSDNQLAYTFQYPTETASGKQLRLRLARGPSTYSSAPLLTPDGRQRIVTQLMDLNKNVTITVTVGPASGALKVKAPEEWRPNEVALTVLIERSTARVSSGQRVALNDVEDVRQETREGAPFWVYEHISQGSPNSRNRENETYRHALAATTFRTGQTGAPYLYSLNLSCPQELWEDLEPQFVRAVDSFHLTTPSRDYVAPDGIGFVLPQLPF